MKYCPKCEVNKPLSGFSKSHCRKGGLQSHCKACRLIYQAEYRKTQAGKEAGKRYRRSDGGKESDRKYRQTDACKEAQRRYDKSPKGKESGRSYRQSHKEEISEAARRYNSANPEKKKARVAVNNAIRDGRLERSIFCEECGLPANTHGHHEDYVNRPLDVNWLCIKCHVELHRKLQLV